MAKHYPISPSSLGRILACPGSRQFKSDGRSSDYADEGTRAHDRAAALLRESIAGVASTWTDDEVDAAVGHYVRYCHAWHDRGTVAAYVEDTFVSKFVPDFGGTPDFAMVTADRRGVIVDFKYGAGVPVVAEKNPQLLAYCVLLLEKHPDLRSFVTAIVQPRTAGEPVDECPVTLAEVREFAATIRTLPATGGFCPGEHCRWCPGLAVCPELHEKAFDLAAQEFDAVVADDNSANWPRLMELAGPLKKMLDAIPGRMLAAMKSGRQFDGWKVVKATPGNREWAADDATILKSLAKHKIGKRVACESRLKSPTQLDKAGYGDAIAPLVTRRDRGFTVAPATDKREPVDFATPEETFDDLSFLE